MDRVNDLLQALETVSSVRHKDSAFHMKIIITVTLALRVVTELF